MRLDGNSKMETIQKKNNKDNKAEHIKCRIKMKRHEYWNFMKNMQFINNVQQQ